MTVNSLERTSELNWGFWVEALCVWGLVRLVLSRRARLGLNKP